MKCIVLTGHGSIDLAVKAIKEGAEQVFDQAGHVLRAPFRGAELRAEPTEPP